MHNSQGGTALEGAAGGSMILLRGNVTSRAEIHKLCLQCHASNGAQASTAQQPHGQVAPKVYSAATWDFTTDAFNKIGAGGNFSTELDASWDATTGNYLGYGHSLGATNVTPPGGDTSISEFSCTNCHDPHGADNEEDANINLFRNLKVEARGAGAESGVKFYKFNTFPEYRHESYVGGINGSYFGGTETDNNSQVIWPVYRGTLTGVPTTDSANSNQYGTGNDTSGATPGNTPATMSRWCAQCHDNWHENITPTNQAHFDGATDLDSRRHAVNSMVPRKSIASCAVGCHISLLDRTNYSQAKIQAGMGLPVTASQYYATNAYYLPWEDPGTCGSSPNIGCMDGVATDRNHRVFCLSCHFAHAGPYRDNLRWDYLSSVEAPICAWKVPHFPLGRNHTSIAVGGWT